MISHHDTSEFEFETVRTAELSAAQIDVMLGLFDTCYREASHGHMERSLTRLRHVTFASRGGRTVGFGIADGRVVDLPRLPRTAITLGGLCCVSDDVRRHGLFGAMMRRSIMAGEVPEKGPALMGGRFGHPAGIRGLASNRGVVPKVGVTPTPWQQDVGQAIADIYGVQTFDRETFVCIGSGTPVGYPIIEIEAEPSEWDAFRNVDRPRGDQLLAISWVRDVPEGWEDS